MFVKSKFLNAYNNKLHKCVFTIRESSFTQQMLTYKINEGIVAFSTAFEGCFAKSKTQRELT